MQAGDGAEIHNIRGPRAYYTDVGKRECNDLYTTSSGAHYLFSKSGRLAGGLELWQGFFQSVWYLHAPLSETNDHPQTRSARASIGHLLINVDISMSVMSVSLSVDASCDLSSF